MKFYGMDVDFLLKEKVEPEKPLIPEEEQRLLNEIHACDTYIKFCKHKPKKVKAFEYQLKLLKQLEELRNK